MSSSSLFKSSLEGSLVSLCVLKSLDGSLSLLHCALKSSYASSELNDVLLVLLNLALEELVSSVACRSLVCKTLLQGSDSSIELRLVICNTLCKAQDEGVIVVNSVLQLSLSGVELVRKACDVIIQLSVEVVNTSIDSTDVIVIILTRNQC